MRHTVILDEAERERRMVNHLNEILRHCRIGKVRVKTRQVAMPFKPGQPFFGWPASEEDIFTRKWVPSYSADHTGNPPIAPIHGVLM